MFAETRVLLDNIVGIRPFIHKLDFAVVWKVIEAEVDTGMPQLIVSGVSPDGIPYSAWRLGGPQVRKSLHSLTQYLTSVGNVHELLNQSLRVYLLTGE